MTVSAFLAEYLPDDIILSCHTQDAWQKRDMTPTDRAQGWADIEPREDGTWAFPVGPLDHAARWLPTSVTPSPDTILSDSGYAYALAVLAATERDLLAAGADSVLLRPAALAIIDDGHALPLAAVITTVTAAALDEHHGATVGTDAWAEEMMDAMLEND